MQNDPAGLITWLLASAAAFAVARMIPKERAGVVLELGAALVSGTLAGMVATALNFGGWQVVSPHAAGFAAAVAMTAIALVRLLRGRAQRPQAVDPLPSPPTKSRS